jgi:integrase
MSIKNAIKITKNGSDIKGVYLIYDTDSNHIDIDDLPAGVQKNINFKLRFKVKNKTAERKITIKAKTYKSALKLAIAKREDLIEDLRIGKLEQTRVKYLTLNEAMNEFLEFKKPSLKQRTYEYYEQTYNKWIKPKLGKKILKEITSNDLQLIANDILQKNMAPRTAQSIKQITRPLFKYFRDKGIISGNPATLIQLPKFDNTINVSLTQDEIKRLYRTIYNYPIEPFRTLFSWLAEGRRLNELLSIEWEQIDFENQVYSIKSNKNKAGINMQYRLRDNIKEALENFDIKGNYVFPAVTNYEKSLSKETVRNHWKKILKEANIAHLRIHDLRHILGNELVSNKYTLEEIAQVLGHTSTSVTKRYSKIREEKASEALDSFFERINQ